MPFGIPPSYRRIKEVVGKIPRGRVMTYGDVATAAGMHGAARVVGYAMHRLGENVPWQRVIGRRSRTTGQLTINDPRTRTRQQRLLEQEGVRFSPSGGIELGRFGWVPRPRRAQRLAK